MAEHWPTPWRQFQRTSTSGTAVIIEDVRGEPLVHCDSIRRSTGVSIALADHILRAVNAVAGPTDGPVDLEAALVHADGIDDGGLHQAADMVRALVGEVVRLREELQGQIDRMHREHPVVRPRMVRDELDDETTLSDSIPW